jgi:myo-inositol-1(or 4)-monophosphatase
VVNVEMLDQQLLPVARKAALVAARLLVNERPEVLQTESKSSLVDIVTDMDRRSETAIRDVLARQRPDDSILGEEGGASEGTSGVTWIVDPLDGTVNYLYDQPSWAVSIAAEYEGLARVGVVAVPMLGLTFFATRGTGAYLDEDGVVAQIGVSAATDVSQSLVATGFGYKRGRRGSQVRALVDILPNVRDIRRLGAAAVDLCFVASGRVDAYFERGLSPWDVAAGALIATEAGAVVEPADDSYATDKLYFAAAPGIAAEFKDLLLRAGAQWPDLSDNFDE